MMECARAGDPAQFCVTVRPDSPAGRPGLRLAMFVLLPGSGLVGAFFLSQGIWPVVLVMGLPISGLLWSFRQLERQAGDYERLTLAEDRLILESHSTEGDRRLEFNSRWVQVELQPDPAGRGSILNLRSHGKAVAFGRLLSEEERARLGRELRLQLARIQH